MDLELKLALPDDTSLINFLGCPFMRAGRSLRKILEFKKAKGRGKVHFYAQVLERAFQKRFLRVPMRIFINGEKAPSINVHKEAGQVIPSSIDESEGLQFLLFDELSAIIPGRF